MDPLTHGVVGAMAAAPFADQSSRKRIGLIGFGAAMLPDIEAFFILPDDPLFNLEIHRQFTHSLIFIPVGAFVAAALFWLIFRNRFTLRQIYTAALAGYGTHWFIDLVTSYGTEIFWPFVDTRYALNVISVVDPVVTGGLLVLAGVAFLKNKPSVFYLGWAWLILFFAFGWMQNVRADDAMHRVAAERGHTVGKYVVKPTIGNQLLWRATYISSERVYTAGIRTNYFSYPEIYEGESVPLINLQQEYSELNGSKLYRDLQRFSRMSEGYLVRHPCRDDVIGDARYSMLPTSMLPLWGVKIDPGKPDEHVEFLYFRDSGEAVRNAFYRMLSGKPTPES